MERTVRVIEKTEECADILYRSYKAEWRKKWVSVGKEEYCFPITYTYNSKMYDEFQVRDTDVFVAAFPKCGTTWTQEMVWLICNDLDYKRAGETIHTRFPYFDTSAVTYLDKSNPVQTLNAQQGVRYIKTHFPFQLLPAQIQNHIKNPKIVYVARNPKDTCVSYYHFSTLIEGYTGSLDDMCKLFLSGKVEYGPYFNHLLSFWNQRHLENILIITYEDMKRDLSGVIEKVASFLGKSVGEKDLPKLVDHLSFAKMKDNRAVNYKSFVETSVKDGEIDPEVAEKKKFMRAGRVGSYKEEMSEEMNEMFDRWIEKNVSGTDFPGWSL